MQEVERRGGARGASFVGLLVVIVVLGALSATAYLGVSSLTDSGTSLTGTDLTGSGTGNPTTSSAHAGNGGSGAAGRGIVASSCAASADAARAATAVYYANNGGTYPVKWPDLTASNPALYELAKDVVVDGANPKQLDGPGWKLTLAGGGTTQPTFTCAAETPNS